MTKYIVELHVTNKIVKSFLAWDACNGERKVLYTSIHVWEGPLMNHFRDRFIKETIIPR